MFCFTDTNTKTDLSFRKACTTIRWTKECMSVIYLFQLKTYFPLQNS